MKRKNKILNYVSFPGPVEEDPKEEAKRQKERKKLIEQDLVGGRDDDKSLAEILREKGETFKD